MLETLALRKAFRLGPRLIDRVSFCHDRLCWHELLLGFICLDATIFRSGHTRRIEHTVAFAAAGLTLTLRAVSMDELLKGHGSDALHFLTCLCHSLVLSHASSSCMLLIPAHHLLLARS